MNEDWRRQSPEVRIETKLLEQFRYLTQYHVADSVIAEPNLNLRVEKMTEQIVRGMLYEIEMTLVGEETQIIHEYPDGWWEAFKQRWFPTLPVRLKRHVTTVRQVFPGYVPNSLGPVRYTVMNEFPVRWT